MVRLRSGDLCPECGTGELERMRRKKWMRHLPASKHYRCADCRARFLTIYGWALRLPMGRKKPEAASD